MLTVALPNKGTLSESVLTMVIGAGYRTRPDGRDLTTVDEANGVRVSSLRPRDVAVYVGRGDIDLGITGRDMALDTSPHGLESPTVAPLRDDTWVAVRAFVPKADVNDVFDALADLGAKGILASDVRSARL